MVINPFLLVPPSMLDSLPTKHKLPERHDNVLRQGQPSNSQLLKLDLHCLFSLSKAFSPRYWNQAL